MGAAVLCRWLTNCGAEIVTALDERTPGAKVNKTMRLSIFGVVDFGRRNPEPPHGKKVFVRGGTCRLDVGDKLSGLINSFSGFLIAHNGPCSFDFNLLSTSAWGHLSNAKWSRKKHR